jgi:hypothetical protein
MNIRKIRGSSFLGGLARLRDRDWRRQGVPQNCTERTAPRFRPRVRVLRRRRDESEPANRAKDHFLATLFTGRGAMIKVKLQIIASKSDPTNERPAKRVLKEEERVADTRFSSSRANLRFSHA